MTPSKERKESMVLLITHLFNNLPCPDCTQHAEKMLIETPIRCDSRPELLSWVVHIHNQINARTGKRFNWTVDEAKEAFTERQFGDITVKDVNKNQRLRREDTKVILRQQAEIVLLKQRLGDTKKKLPSFQSLSNKEFEQFLETFTLSLQTTEEGVEEENVNNKTADDTDNKTTEQNNDTFQITAVVLLSVIIIVSLSILTLIAVKPKSMNRQRVE